MKKTFIKINGPSGFSLLEMILTLVLVGIIVFVSTNIMINQADMYSFTANRKATISDLRSAVTNISNELSRITTSDINNIYNKAISFTDASGTNTSYRLDASGALYRGSKPMVDNIQDVKIRYMDGNGNPLSPTPANISFVKRIQFTIATKPRNKEESITISTYITPRAFLGYDMVW